MPTKRDTESEPSENFAGLADSAEDSRDSALQYVCFDLYDAGFDEPEQRKILQPVEAEMRRHWDSVMRQAIGKAFERSPGYAAEWVTDELAARMTYEDVPEGYHGEVQEAVEQRLEEKHYQLHELYEDIVYDVKRKALVIPEDTLVNWGTIV